MTNPDPSATPGAPGPALGGPGGFAAPDPTPAPTTAGPDAPPSPPSSGTFGATRGFASQPPSGGAPGWSPTWPERHEQSPGLAVGILLVVIGSVFLALRVGNVALGPDAWPLWLIVPGLAMVVGSLFIPSRGGLGLSIPGAILAVVGGILWVQDLYGVYATWAYAWALAAPTAPGLAMLLYGTVHRDGGLVRDGLRTTLTGVGLFLGFGLFFEGVIGISGHRIQNLDQVLPYAAIGLGALLIVIAFVDGGGHDSWRDQRRAERRADRDRRRAERQAAKAARRAGA